MKEWGLERYLPASWVSALSRLSATELARAQELRLRAGEPVTVSTSLEEWYLCEDGLTARMQPSVFRCSVSQLENCFLRFCDGSIYAHEEELRQGFLRVQGGIRVGVSGRAVVRDGQVTTLSSVTGLCIRLPRDHRGCAAELLPYILEKDTLISSLLVGEPASGKTSLLRDVAVGLAARRKRVTVVDERGELAGSGGLRGCEVLSGCPKAQGILQAIRCLAPQVIVFDELGDEEEMRAVAACAHAGVAVVASLHGDDPRLLKRRSSVRNLAQQEVFRRWLFLQGRARPGQLRECLEPEVRDDDLVWRVADYGGGDRAGSLLCATTVSAGGVFEANGATFGDDESSVDFFSSSYGGTVEGSVEYLW